MSYLGNKPLRELLPNIIHPFNASHLKSAHYELTLGREAFVTGLDNDKRVNLEGRSTSITIESGQFALLLTEEIIRIPNDKIAFISIKASQKFKGLINISGFHVDPGFEGKLLFSVYNAGPSKIILERFQKYFLLWISHLDGEASYNGKHNNQKKIPISHIENLSGTLASPNSVLKRIDSLQQEYDSRITKAEGNSTTLRWMLSILISLLIALNIKQCNDSKQFEDGYNAGLKKEYFIKKHMNEIDSTIDSKIQSHLNNDLNINE